MRKADETVAATQEAMAASIARRQELTEQAVPLLDAYPTLR